MWWLRSQNVLQTLLLLSSTFSSKNHIFLLFSDRKKMSLFAYDWNKSSEERSASPRSFTFFFKAAACL